ncbi:MAG: hypothetical protein ABWX96_22075, partial [Propionibacteriaceae bacterium]
MTLTFLLAPLNGNLRYEAGVKTAATASAAGTFSHRPLAFRVLSDGVFRVSAAMTDTIVGFELAVRLVVLLLAVSAGLLLWQGLLRRGVRDAGLHAGVVVGALVLLGPISAAEPEWSAVVLTTAGLGLALLGRRNPWLWAALAGTAFVAAAGLKIISLPTACLGLAAVALIDRRQALRTLGACLGVGLLYVLATVIWVPWEVQWLLDIRTVQNSALDAVPGAPAFFVQLAAERPVLVALPAALVLDGTRERILVMIAAAVCCATVLVQGQYFDYHAIPLVVVATVAVFRSYRGRVNPAIGLAAAGLIAVTTVMTGLPGGWLSNHERVWTATLVIIATAAVVWTVRTRSWDAGRRVIPSLAAALTGLALLYPGASPWSAHLLMPVDTDGNRPQTTIESRDSKTVTAEQVRRVLGGPEAPVTYLTFGEWTYFIGNPTSCRYPSPLFLQRTRKPDRLPTRSYRENLKCLSAPDARWLIVDPSWFIASRQPPEVKTVLDTEWDCENSV